MAPVRPSRPIFRSPRQRARRRALSGFRLLVAALLTLGATVVVVLLVLLVVGLVVG